MFGMRVLIFLLGIGLVVWILVRLAKGSKKRDQTVKKVDDMVRCAVCGVFVPRHEALEKDGRHYCSDEHRDAERKPDD